MGLIRLILAISVVAVHSNGIFGMHFINGQVAVQAFYIISGFYMTMILNEKYIGISGSYKLFITNRLLRLYPIYWAVLICTVAFLISIALIKGAPAVPIIEGYMNIKHSLISIFVLSFTNIFIAGSDALMFMWLNPATGYFTFTANFWLTNPPTHSFLFIPPVWTVGLEILFYVFAPFIVRRNSKTVFILLALTIVLRIFLFNGLSLIEDPWTYRFFPTELMFFLLGYFSYKKFISIKNREIDKKIQLAAMIFVLFFSLIYSFLPEVRFSFLPFSMKEILYFSTFSFSIPYIFKYCKNSKMDLKLGDLSYPIYISHTFIIYIFHEINVSAVTMGAYISIVCVIFSIMLNKFISNPLEKFRQQRVLKNSSLTGK